MNKLMNGDVLVAESVSPIVWDEQQQGYAVDNCVYVGSHFTVVSTPSSVTPRQIRQALTRAGLRDVVEAGVAAGDQDTKDWWEFSTEFLRDHPEVIAMGIALGKTDLEVDAIFKLAATL